MTLKKQFDLEMWLNDDDPNYDKERIKWLENKHKHFMQEYNGMVEIYKKVIKENKQLRVLPEALINEAGDYGMDISDYVDMALETTKDIELFIKDDKQT